MKVTHAGSLAFANHKLMCRPIQLVFAVLISILVLTVALLTFLNTSSQGTLHSRSHHSRFKHIAGQRTAARTLVLYTFSDTDPEYYKNFLYFLDYGLGGSSVHYIFILQGMSISDVNAMPPLPSNAIYVTHKNECFDWGTFGWLLKSGKVDIRDYLYFIFMNSSVRGPYLPAYNTDKMHWTSIYTQRLNRKVKLVGSTINCQPVYWQSDPANELRHNPHVQSYVAATDQVGLKTLLDDTNVFRCHESLLDTVWHSEVGASRAIFNAGYTIDCLMIKYMGVDWRNKSNWQCNGWQNPYADFAYDGVMINPLEVLFVKVKSYQLESDWITSKMAQTYERWQRSKGQDASVNVNVFDKARFSYFMSKAITMGMRGSACFDLAYYRKSNPDIPYRDISWDHFVNQGQFEGRPFRFTCENRFAYPSEAVLQRATDLARRSINSALVNVDQAYDKDITNMPNRDTDQLL